MKFNAMNVRMLLVCLFVAVARIGAAESIDSKPSSKLELNSDSRHEPESLYEFAGTWKNQSGGDFTLHQLKGQQVALAFFYSTCQAVCPLIVNTMATIEKKLHGATQTPAQFVLISLDPETDTVSALKAYASAHNLSSESWHLLHGTPEQVRTLSVLLQAKYAPAADGQISHSNFIAVLDDSGTVLGSAAGVPANADTLLKMFKTK